MKASSTSSPSSFFTHKSNLLRNSQRTANGQRLVFKENFQGIPKLRPQNDLQMIMMSDKKQVSLRLALKQGPIHKLFVFTNSANKFMDERSFQSVVIVGISS